MKIISILLIIFLEFYLILSLSLFAADDILQTIVPPGLGISEVRVEKEDIQLLLKKTNQESIRINEEGVNWKNFFLIENKFNHNSNMQLNTQLIPLLQYIGSQVGSQISVKELVDICEKSPSVSKCQLVEKKANNSELNNLKEMIDWMQASDKNKYHEGNINKKKTEEFQEKIYEKVLALQQDKLRLIITKIHKLSINAVYKD
ncbi:MAG: hypothetical protein HQK49_21385 [Oligoflexia bacterium]|nr:hypothetical protein [Oligoflexia bacterium]